MTKLLNKIYDQLPWNRDCSFVFQSTDSSAAINEI